MDNFTAPKETELVDFLLSTDIFHGIDSKVILKLLPELEIVFLRSQDSLFQEGDHGEDMYLVYIGRLRVYKNEKGEQKFIAELSAKEEIGEIAILIDQPRMASVIAIRDTILIKLSKQIFQKFMEEYPQAGLTVAKRSLSRVMAKEIVTKKVHALAVIPMSASPIIEVFMRQWLAALEKYDTIQLVTEEMLNEKFGDNTEGIFPWLCDLESRYRYIIYLPKYGFSKFTHLFISQSDEIFLINDPDSTKEIKRDIEKNILENDRVLQKTNLIILRGNAGTKFEFMSSWIVEHKLDNYYHVALDQPADISRLVRAITANSVGLVLSGGGAAGLAHIGLIRALEEQNIPIDFIGGTSAGALIGGAYALGLSPEMMEQKTHELIEKSSKLSMTIPFTSLDSGATLVRGLIEMFGQTRIEDQARRFYCVSTNLSIGELRVHDSGLFWEAVRASVSLPGIYPPVFSNGDVFVDGGILNNLPVDVMRRQFGVGKVIAAKFDRSTRELSADFDAFQLSGWSILANKLNPFGKKNKIPRIRDILSRSFSLAEEKEQLRQSKMADLSVFLKMQNFKMLDFSKYREIIAQGYEQAKIALENWEK